MKNNWFIWIFILGVIFVVIIALNHQSKEKAVPLSEIFPEEETYPVDIEYEFVSGDDQASSAAATKTAVETTVTQEVKPVVTTEVQKTEPVTKTATKPKVEEKKDILFTLQVASFKDMEKAQAKLNELKKAGYTPFIVKRDLQDKGVWYRVYVGSFQSKAEADKFLTEFKKKYPNSFVISPK